MTAPNRLWHIGLRVDAGGVEEEGVRLGVLVAAFRAPMPEESRERGWKGLPEEFRENMELTGAAERMSLDLAERIIERALKGAGGRLFGERSDERGSATIFCAADAWRGERLGYACAGARLRGDIGEGEARAALWRAREAAEEVARERGWKAPVFALLGRGMLEGEFDGYGEKMEETLERQAAREEAERLGEALDPSERESAKRSL